MGWEEILKKKKKYASKPVWKPMSKPKIAPINHRKMNMDKLGKLINYELKELKELLVRVDKMLEVAPKAIGLIGIKKDIQETLDDFNNKIDSGPITYKDMPLHTDYLKEEINQMEEESE